MICAKPLDGYLQIVQLAPNESCQYITLIEKTDLIETVSYLDEASAFEIIGAAASLYALAYVIKMVLIQLGFRG
ncbi:hypothetical protein FKN13_07395 [Vibrio sp. 2-2(9)]|uniref:hypothetical protein n=1 Tax=Vibrio TaxID=662 RepID=UPI0004638E6C|nr:MULTISPECIES: hypothetical protein [Vibrio]NNN50560.1 hypothetical protein [Vibrio sp. 2-2(7)]NNN50569.1 hypothetical protein [Vibrio sp. 2-2(7)]NNN87255.1 hypothetical protein [Vibrio sp. 2-2(9)]NNN87264.1 hypothetical protein [Vibrio sp. 2-2(9)]